MSSASPKPRIGLSEVRAIAEATQQVLTPYCERIAIAGSIRRQKQMVGDIEIVCIPLQEPADLFGETRVACQGFCAAVTQWPKIKGEPTGKYTQRRLPEGIILDLFMADVDNWGSLLAVRTGSAAFSHRVLATGWVKAGYTSFEGHLYRQGQLVPVHEEIDLFGLLGLPWIEPWAREI